MALQIAIYLNGKVVSVPNEASNETSEFHTEQNNNNKSALFLTNQGDEMKGITRRTDGRLMVRKMIQGRRKTLYAHDFNAAKKILTKLKHNNFKEEPKQHIYTINEWITEWREKYKKPFVTARTYREIVNETRKINSNFGNMFLNDLHTETIQDFMNKLKSGKTKDTLTIYFNALLQKAEDLNLLNKNPFKAVIRDKKQQYKQFNYNYGEQKQIIENSKHAGIYEEVLCYLLTGAGPNEFPKKEYFDFVNNTVEIHGTKNDTRKLRIVNLSESYCKHLNDFFKNIDFKKENEVSELFKEANKEIKKPTLYRLRHTFATNTYVLSKNIKYIQHCLGHKSINTTMNVYTDADQSLNKNKIFELYGDYYYIPNS